MQEFTNRRPLVVAMLDNVKGQVLSFAHANGPSGGKWTSSKLDLPADSSLPVTDVVVR